MSGVGQINRVITHPTLPLTVTAHDDRHIRFFDNNTGKALVESLIITVRLIFNCITLLDGM